MQQATALYNLENIVYKVDFFVFLNMQYLIPNFNRYTYITFAIDSV